MVPGLQRHPLKKLQADPVALLLLLQRWRDEATKAGHTINRIAVAFEAGRDGFWLARRRIQGRRAIARSACPLRAPLWSSANKNERTREK